MNNCLHVTQGEGGELVAWSDDLMTPGSLRYANGLRPPARTAERYGSVASLEEPAPGVVLLQLKVLAAGGNPVIFAGRLSPDGLSIGADRDENKLWLREHTWTRLPGNAVSCSDRLAARVSPRLPERRERRRDRPCKAPMAAGTSN